MNESDALTTLKYSLHGHPGASIVCLLNRVWHDLCYVSWGWTMGRIMLKLRSALLMWSL